MPGPVGPQTPIQLSLLDEALGLIQSLAIMEVSPPNYTQCKLGTEVGEFFTVPTTHLVATVNDLTDMLDYASEDINDMDDDVDVKQSQNPPITGRWTATSIYDVHMVDTLEEKVDKSIQDPRKHKPVDEPPKHCVSGAAHGRVGQRIALLALEIMKPRTMPNTTQSNPRLNKTRRRRVTIALSTQITRARRIAITNLSLKRM